MVSGEPILDNAFILDFQPMQPPGFRLIKALGLGSVGMAAQQSNPGTREHMSHSEALPGEREDWKGSRRGNVITSH